MRTALSRIAICILPLLMAACGTLPQSGPTRGVTATPMDKPLAVPACAVGEEYSLKGHPELFRLDVLTVNKSARALEFLDHKTPAGEYILPLYNALIQGEKDGSKEVQRFTGETEITISFLGINVGGVPNEVPYLSGLGPRGNGLCRGYARVTKIGTNEIRVAVPMRGGSDLGQASIVLPRAVMEGFPQILGCVTWNIKVHVPTLDLGPRRGWPNTSCGLPGNWPGYTLLGERISQKHNWTLFGAVVIENDQTPGANTSQLTN